jgi:hypothetical protein
MTPRSLIDINISVEFSAYIFRVEDLLEDGGSRIRRSVLSVYRTTRRHIPNDSLYKFGASPFVRHLVGYRAGKFLSKPKKRHLL